MGDWIFDHTGWLLGALTIAVAGVIIWAVASGAASGPACPKGQHLELIYMQPIIGANGVESMIPIFGCES